MKFFQRSFGSIVQINTHLLFAAISSVIAYAIWPTHPKWWGFGLLAVFLFVIATSSVIAAARTAFALYARDKVLAEFLAQGNKPKSATLAGDDALKDAGMIE